MDSETKELLKANLELSKENNVLLKKIRKVQKRIQVTKTVYWVIVILVALGAYYYVKPYVGRVESFYNQAAANLEEFKNFGSAFSNFGNE